MEKIEVLLWMIKILSGLVICGTGIGIILRPPKNYWVFIIITAMIVFILGLGMIGWYYGRFR